MARSLLSLALVVTVASLVPPGLASGQVVRDEVTVTATGIETPLEGVPLTVRVVTREELVDAQVDTVADVLRRVPGVTVVRSGNEGKVTSVFTRGTESDHTLVLFDGVRLNSPFFGGYDWSLLGTGGLERVEVASGPFSALWGSDAMGATIQLVPRRGANGLAGDLMVEGGSEEWRRGELTTGYGRGALDGLLSGTFRSSDGDSPNSDFELRQGLLDLGWSVRGRGRLGLLVQDLESTTGIPFYVPGTPSPDRRQTQRQRLLALPVDVTMLPGWGLEGSLSLVDRILDFEDPDDPFGYVSARTEASSFAGRMASRHDLDTHRLSWGGEWRRDEVDDRSSFGVNLADRRYETRSLFVQDEWRPTDRWQLVFGGRWDETDEWDGELSPRLHAGVRLGDRAHLRLGYGHGFRQPSIGELYYPFSGNPELEPETSDTIEAGLRLELGHGRLLVDLTGYATEIEQLIEFDGATFRFVNVDRAEIRGAEVGLQGTFGRGLESHLHLAWLQAESGDGVRLLRRPEWSGSWRVGGLLGGRWRGDLVVLWVGARDDVDPVSFERVGLPEHVVTDAAVAFEVGERLTLTLRVRNLFDEKYGETAGYPAPDRRLLAGLRVDW